MNINQAAVGDISSWDSWQLRLRRSGETSKVIISWFSVRERAEQSGYEDTQGREDNSPRSGYTIRAADKEQNTKWREVIGDGGNLIWGVMIRSASHQVAAAGLGSVTSRVHKFLHQHQLHRIYTILWEEIGTFDTKIPSLRVGFEDLC